jgi:hypothetical protein
MRSSFPEWSAWHDMTEKPENSGHRYPERAVGRYSNVEVRVQ